MLKACVICATPCKTGRCDRHPKPRSPSSEATSKRSHKQRRAGIEAAHTDKPMTCAICRDPILPGQPWDLDHTVPVAAGGEHGPVAPAHRSCNRSKGAGGRAEDHEPIRPRTLPPRSPRKKAPPENLPGGGGS